MRDGHVGNRNDIQWRAYQKYSADATLTFEDSDTTPASGDQNKQPAPAKK
jgi:hypothetical protein